MIIAPPRGLTLKKAGESRGASAKTYFSPSLMVLAGQLFRTLFRITLVHQRTHNCLNALFRRTSFFLVALAGFAFILANPCARGGSLLTLVSSWRCWLERMFLVCCFRSSRNVMRFDRIAPIMSSNGPRGSSSNSIASRFPLSSSHRGAGPPRPSWISRRNSARIVYC